MARGDFFTSALQNANPASQALSAVSGFASGGPSSSGDTSGGNADFGVFNIGGISRGLGGGTPDNQMLILLGIGAVALIALLRR